jgi:hypothetical protein
MARGNLVDFWTIKICNKFNLEILEHKEFWRYDKFKISNAGTLMGVWGSRVSGNYKDYLVIRAYKNWEIIRITKTRIFLKRKKEN